MNLEDWKTQQCIRIMELDEGISIVNKMIKLKEKEKPVDYEKIGSLVVDREKYKAIRETLFNVIHDLEKLKL